MLSLSLSLSLVLLRLLMVAESSGKGSSIMAVLLFSIAGALYTEPLRVS
jgi:hypothetical protein